jgi:hypothetical protein
MHNEYIACLVYVVISVCVISVLLYLLTRCQNKDKFCVCHGMNNKICSNTQQLRDLYNSGKLTEYSALQKDTSKWSQVPPQFHTYYSTMKTC